MSTKNEFQLFKERRYWPLFTTQFLGAMNDNVYKNALIIMIAFGGLHHTVNADTLINILAALFILPYFLFSALAGQIADKFEKSKLITITKIVEIILAIVIMIGFYFHHFVMLAAALFLLGTQATFFGPMKYSMLPQLLNKSELLGGNGLMEMGTFVAVLFGTILGSIIIGIPIYGVVIIAVMIVSIAIIGFLSSLFIPTVAIGEKNLVIDWNLFRQTFILVRDTFRDKILCYAIIGISWFWFYGSLIITQIPAYTKNVLNGNEHIITLLLAAFSVGIGVGSTLTEWLTSKKVVMGFVFIGMTGLSLFGIDLALSTSSKPPIELNILTFFTYQENYRIFFDAFFLAAFSGLYQVPLYTLMQIQSKENVRSRVICVNNIINALFMVAAAVFAIVILHFGFSIPFLYFLTGIINIGVALYLIKLAKLLKS